LTDFHLHSPCLTCTFIVRFDDVDGNMIVIILDGLFTPSLTVPYVYTPAKPMIIRRNNNNTKQQVFQQGQVTLQVPATTNVPPHRVHTSFIAVAEVVAHRVVFAAVAVA
jgi:hypothetical protein